MDFGLRDWARRAPQRTAVVRADGRHIGYGALDALTDRLAQLVRASGLVRGDHVAALLGNDALFFALAWACWRSGVYLTPISTHASVDDALHLVRDSRAQLVLVDARCEAVAQAVAAAMRGVGRCLACDSARPEHSALHAALAALPGTPIADESPGALMLYTSGTTGAAKGVWRPLPTSSEGPPAFARDLIDIYRFPSDARFFSPAPLYHAAALRFGLAMLAVGARVHLAERFDAVASLDLLARERITHSLWVPTMLQRMLNLPAGRRAAHRADAHVMAMHAAAPCPAPLKRAMLDWWGPILHEFYGGTESVGFCTIGPQEWLAHPGSVGRAHRGVVHVLDECDEELPPGATGRIAFSGSSRFEYFGDPVKTASRLSRQGYQTFGDIGHVDADGYLYLTDRMDDMIISGGVNIYPQEVEAALAQAPQVADCAVVGLPDAEYGERVVAFVVLRDAVADPTHTTDTAGTLAQLRDFCQQRLGSVKRPKEFHVLAQLPRSPLGKLLRRELRRLQPATAPP